MANMYKIGNGSAVAIPDNATDEETRIGMEKARRNNYLAECDWTQGADSPLSESKKTAWATYRQKLRDLDTSTDPKNITWPTKPS